MKRVLLLLVVAGGVLGLLLSPALPLDYTFYNVDYVGTRNELVGISSSDGTILGWSSSKYFLYDITSATITDITETPGVKPFNFLSDINNDGDIVGNDGTKSDGNDFAFYLEESSSGYDRTPFNYPYDGGVSPEGNFYGTYAYGVNDGNHVAGTFNDPTSIYEWTDPGGVIYQYPRARGFLATDVTDPLSFMPIDASGAFTTSGKGINNLDWVVGYYRPSSETYDTRSFLYNGATYFDVYVNDPGVRRVEASGVNDNGDIVGTAGNSMNIGNGYGFLYSQADDAFYKILYPGSPATHVTGIDNLGRIVGLYFGDDEWDHGFFAVPGRVDNLPWVELEQIQGSVAPIPEPATMLLIGTGLVGLAGFRRKFRRKE